MAPLREYSNEFCYIVVYEENNLQWYVNDANVLQLY